MTSFIIVYPTMYYSMRDVIRIPQHVSTKWITVECNRERGREGERESARMGVLLHCPIRHGLHNRALAPAPPSSVHQERFNALACPLVPRLQCVHTLVHSTMTHHYDSYLDCLSKSLTIAKSCLLCLNSILPVSSSRRPPCLRPVE